MNESKLQPMNEHQQELVLGVLDLCYQMASDFARRWQLWNMLDELQSAACMGAIRASMDYEPDRGAFTTYSYHWIRSQLGEALRRKKEGLTSPDRSRDSGSARG